MRRLPIIMALSVVALCAACSQAPDVSTDPSAVTAAVTRYNGALVRAFAEQDMNELDQVATKDQAYTEYQLMAALGESRVRMLASLRHITFGDVAFSSDSSATVATTETWDYIHQSMDTSETLREEKGVTYHLRYDLVRVGDRWLVDRVTSLDDTSSAPITGQ